MEDEGVSGQREQGLAPNFFFRGSALAPARIILLPVFLGGGGYA